MRRQNTQKFGVLREASQNPYPYEASTILSSIMWEMLKHTQVQPTAAAKSEKEAATLG